MLSNCIKLYMDGFYTQMDFHRFQERENRSSDEKVMVVQSWRLHMNSDLRIIRTEPEKISVCFFFPSFFVFESTIQVAPMAQPRPKRLLDGK